MLVVVESIGLNSSRRGKKASFSINVPKIRLLFCMVTSRSLGLIQKSHQPDTESDIFYSWCEISSYRGGEYEAQNLLGCTAVFLFEFRPTFQRWVLTPSSVYPRRFWASSFIPIWCVATIPEWYGTKSHSFVFPANVGLFTFTILPQDAHEFRHYGAVTNRRAHLYEILWNKVNKNIS
jgi:hypothetical protein